jgi:hypothetical protein
MSVEQQCTQVQVIGDVTRDGFNLLHFLHDFPGFDVFQSFELLGPPLLLLFVACFLRVPANTRSGVDRIRRFTYIRKISRNLRGSKTRGSKNVRATSVAFRRSSSQTDFNFTRKEKRE